MRSAVPELTPVRRNFDFLLAQSLSFPHQSVCKQRGPDQCYLEPRSRVRLRRPIIFIEIESKNITDHTKSNCFVTLTPPTIFVGATSFPAVLGRHNIHDQRGSSGTLAIPLAIVINPVKFQRSPWKQFPLPIVLHCSHSPRGIQVNSLERPHRAVRR